VANPTTNYGFVMPTPTDLVTDLPADFGVFGQAVDTQMKTNADAATQKATLTTKGDIYAATGTSTPARLAVGANDTVLIADSTTATGLKWGTVAGGGMTLIQTITPSGATSVSFTSIATTYKQLYVLFRNVTQSVGSDSIAVRLNNSSAAVYQMFSIEKFTTSIGANVYEDDTSVQRVINNAGTNAAVNARTQSGYFSVLDADQVSNHALEFWSGGVNGSGVAVGTAGRGLFYPTTAAAINRIDFINLSSNTMTGTFQLYGVN
jgi:hypothetical protein